MPKGGPDKYLEQKYDSQEILVFEISLALSPSLLRLPLASCERSSTVHFNSQTQLGKIFIEHFLVTDRVCKFETQLPLDGALLSKVAG